MKIGDIDYADIFKATEDSFYEKYGRARCKHGHECTHCCPVCCSVYGNNTTLSMRFERRDDYIGDFECPKCGYDGPQYKDFCPGCRDKERKKERESFEENMIFQEAFTDFEGVEEYERPYYEWW